MFRARSEVTFKADGAHIKVWPMLGGPVQERTLDVTPDQWFAWERGAYIQDVMFNLDAEQREWLLSGLDGEEFAAAVAVGEKWAEGECAHNWVEVDDEPPYDICNSCGERRD